MSGVKACIDTGVMPCARQGCAPCAGVVGVRAYGSLGGFVFVLLNMSCFVLGIVVFPCL